VINVRRYRRDEEQTRGAEFVRKPFPEQEIPSAKKPHARRHKQGDETLRQDAEFAALYKQFRSKIALAMEVLEQAPARTVPFQTVLRDSWFLCTEMAEALAKRQKDWGSFLKKNRNLEVNSFAVRDTQGQKVAIEGPHLKVEDRVPLIPRSASTQVKV